MADNPGEVFKEIKIYFADFAAMFDAYATRLRETEQIWKNVADIWKSSFTTGTASKAAGSSGADSGFRNDSASAKTLANIEKGQKQFTKANDDWNKGFFNMMTSGNFFSRISKGILSSNLFKFGMGLAGVGGTLYGLDKLASGVAATRFQSMALGAPYGATKATEIAYGGLANPTAEMAAIAAGQRDVTSTQYRALMNSWVHQKTIGYDGSHRNLSSSNSKSS